MVCRVKTDSAGLTSMQLLLKGFLHTQDRCSHHTRHAGGGTTIMITIIILIILQNDEFVSD